MHVRLGMMTKSGDKLLSINSFSKQDCHCLDSPCPNLSGNNKGRCTIHQKTELQDLWSHGLKEDPEACSDDLFSEVQKPGAPL